MTAQCLPQEPKRRDYLKSAGPGVVAGASATGIPTGVAWAWFVAPLALVLWLAVLPGSLVPSPPRQAPCFYRVLAAGTGSGNALGLAGTSG